MVLVIVIKVVHIDCVEFCRGILKYLDVAVFLANFVLVCFTIFVFLVLLIPVSYTHLTLPTTPYV